MSAFDDWVDQSRAWHRDIRVIPDPQVELCTRFADRIEPEIAFGRYAGERRWETLADVPSQEIRDELLRLIVSQADSEVRAVEQARELYESAPTEHDRRRLERHMTEETRHGWQMAYLLVTYFGAEGRSEARKLLERYGQSADLKIGVSKSQGSFEAHAWLEVDGRIVLGKERMHSRYAVLGSNQTLVQ